MFFLGVSLTGLATRLDGGLAASSVASLCEISGRDPVVELLGRQNPLTWDASWPSGKSSSDSVDSGEVRVE